jgi:hypothetical protein
MPETVSMADNLAEHGRQAAAASGPARGTRIGRQSLGISLPYEVIQADLRMAGTVAYRC